MAAANTCVSRLRRVRRARTLLLRRGALNHGGDSDGTGAICGNLPGASLGAGAIDADLLDGLEGRDTITQVAHDLYDVFADRQEPSAERYSADGTAQRRWHRLG